jgi:preprotein translocase subunit SecA
MSVFTKVLRAGEGQKVRRLAELVQPINQLEASLEAMSDDELRHSTVDFKERLDQGENLEDLLIEAFAVVREAAWRILGQRPFDCQLMGGMALHFGWIAEMKTGEGKTLVSTMPVYLNALGGRGVHVITVNDYLASRDAEWMGQVHRWLGLTVGRVSPELDDFEGKRIAYAADITYGTNNEFGFDYLRDNMARSREQMVQRGHPYAIVDEVDSILIDEARTPLIISGPSNQGANLYNQFARLAATLTRDKDYEVDEEKRIVMPREAGIEKVERAVGVENLYDSLAVNYVHQLTKALEAKELWKRDKDYLVAQGEVKIVDEFTGRVLDGRRWSDGLHQAVEAKERVRINDENHTWATVTLQNYFRLYEKLAGMTGTAETEASEFANTYGLAVVPIPTNKELIREDRVDVIFRTEAGKFGAVVDDIVERNQTGQPILVGTASVEKSEVLSQLLERRGVPHQVLNAKQHFREAEVVAQAGRLAGVTVATNMAGRGVDIILGGNPELLAEHEAAARGLDLSSEEGEKELARLREEFDETCRQEGERVRELGGLYVLGSERHESRRIDNQLRGRSGRQGDPGESRFYLSLEDDLLRLFALKAMNWVMTKALPEEVPIDSKLVTKSIERAQSTVEGRNSEARKDILKYDEVMNEQRKVIYARRNQVIDGEDLQTHTQDLLESTVEALVTSACPSDYTEEWDLELLVNELRQYYPTQFSPEDLAEGSSVVQLVASVQTEALEYYEEHCQTLDSAGDEIARKVEREVMLQIIDARWRDHLAEMDHLKDGIYLRAMGNQDPLVAWQRDGFAMFGQLMESIDDDYLRYVLHVDPESVVRPAAEPDLTRAVYVAAEDPVGPALATNAFEPREAAMPEPVAAAVPASNGRGQSGPAAGQPSGAAAAARRAKGGAHAKPGRNDPCSCGSGKKYKLCHGAA